VEDSLVEIRSAKAAGMAVLAVSTTYPLEKLSEADLALPALGEAALDLITDHFSPNRPREPFYSCLHS
jgi:beta-phosphoglucomutase-like phosphatase (HAD superfamily)